MGVFYYCATVLLLFVTFGEAQFPTPIQVSTTNRR